MLSLLTIADGGQIYIFPIGKIGDVAAVVAEATGRVFNKA